MNSYTFNQIDNKYPALGIVLAVCTLLVGILLQYTQRIISIDRYLVTRETFKGSPRLIKAASVFYYVALLIPLLLLIIWSILLFVSFGVTPGLPVLLHGLFVIVLIFPSTDQLYYYKVLTLCLLFVAAQLVTLFTSEMWSTASNYSFFALSAILLILNGCLVSLTLWIIKGIHWELEDSLQPIRDEFIKWCPSWDSASPPLLLTGGLYSTICNHPRKNWITAGIYLLSWMCLLALALIIYYSTSYGILGSVTAIAVATTDLIMAMIINLQNQFYVTPNIASVLVFAIRVCLFGFTAEYWFMGYCLLYMLIMAYVCYLVIDKAYPNFEKIPTMDVKKINVLRTPECVGILTTILFSAIIFYLGNQKNIHIPVTTIKIGSLDYPYWAIGVGAIILAFSFYFYLCSLRILQRKRNRIREFSGCYFGTTKLSEYYIYAFISYCMIVVFGCYFYVTVGEPLIWLITVFIPLIYEAFLQFYRNWEENDYAVLGNVEKYNLKNKKRIENQENLKKKQDQIFQKMKKDSKMMGFFESQKKPKISPLQIVPINGDENKKMTPVNEVSSSNLVENQIQDQEQSELFDFAKPKAKVYQPVEDWRKTSTFWAALLGGKLLPTDKKILISLPVMLALMLIFSLICLLSFNQTMAFTISAEILFLFLTLVPMKRYFSTLQPPEIFEIIMFVLGILLNYAFGAVGLANGWRSEIVWVIWWGFGNILILCFYALWGMIRDYGATLASLIISIVSVLVGIAMGIFILVLVDTAAGIAVIGVSLYAGYFLGLGLYYLKNNNSLPRYFIWITGGLIVGTAVAVMIAGFVLDSFDNFLGFSITYLVLSFLLLGYSIWILYSDISSRIEAPNFYSPYLRPVYKYSSEIESCRTNPLPFNLFAVSLLIILLYCFLVEIFVNPAHVGISLTCLLELFIFLSVTYFQNYNTFNAGLAKQRITKELMADCWAQEKEVQTKLKLVNSSDQGSLLSKMKQDLGKVQVEYASSTDQAKKFELLGQLSDLEYKIQKQTDEQLLVGVNLWVRCVSRVQGLERKDMIKLVTFVNSSQEILIRMGVAIVVDGMLDLEGKYRQISSDYNLLAPEQKIKFDFYMKEWEKERQQNDKKAEERDQKQEEEKRKRDIQLLERLRQQQNQADNDNLPLDKMIDGPKKLKKMLQIYKGNNFYVDPVFKADKSILPEYLRNQCKGFTRPSADSYLMDESDISVDVKQGMIGDCYLISAIGILGLKNLRKMLGIGQWENPKGAYMVKFKKLGRQIYVIIDDQFPVGIDDDWILGQCENQKELFVNVIEKAYAKLYGGYDKIIGGKVNITLAEMTGGFPSQIKLHKFQQTGTAEIFDKMMNYNDVGYLMGAGSPENAGGDSVIIEGIVQGHAYQILRVANLDGNKLIKLRNPHGKMGSQWQGDWSDKSEKWCQRMLELVKEKIEPDGIFWMSLDDFVYCFKSLYVCLTFDEKSWKTFTTNGKWQGEKAAGLPSKANPSAQIAKNPHCGIRTTKKSTIFLQLQQNQVLNSWKGKNFIYYNVQRNNGQRIKAITIEKLCGKSDTAVNTTSVTGQVQLEANTYPYTFSVLVACINPGDTGSFNLVIRCNDFDADLIEDQIFDA